MNEVDLVDWAGIHAKGALMRLSFGNSACNNHGIHQKTCLGVYRG